ncbi:MAG TPA: lysylphosphatidylglycerol synthase transmembrane domain-containing protein [Actinomycetota bacterium]
MKHLSRVAQILLFVAIVVGVFGVILPRVADFDQVWASIRSLTGWQYVFLVVVTLWNILTYWPVTMAGLPGLSLAQAAVVNQSSTSVAMTVPGGGAVAVGVSYAMFRSWGFRRSEIALQALVTGIWNIFMKLALPVIALLILIVHGDDRDALISAAVIGVTILTVVTLGLGMSLWRDRFAESVGAASGAVVSLVRRAFGKPPVEQWGHMAVRFRHQMLELVRRRWPILTVATAVSHLSVFLVMLASLRFAGVSDAEVNWAQALAVFAVVRLASAVPIIPGNIGIAELGYVAGLVIAGGSRAEVVAAVLVFRFLTYYVQIPIGALTYIAWRRRRSWRKEPASRGGGGLESQAPDQEHSNDHTGHPGHRERHQGDHRMAEHRPRRHQEQSPVPTAQEVAEEALRGRGKAEDG